VPLEVCHDPAPPLRQVSADSPDGRFRVMSDHYSIRVVRAVDERPPTELVRLAQLNDPLLRRVRHGIKFTRGTVSGDRFGTMFHLAKLLP